MKTMILILGILLLAACQSTQTSMTEDENVHIGCQDGEISEDGTCTTSSENNAALFGKDYSDTVQTTDVSGQALGYLAKPIEPGSYPGVIMIHEWWGLNDNIKEMARILASEGYVVFAVDLYNGEVAKDSDKARELATSVRSNPEQAVSSMKAALNYLKTEQNAQNIASLGWCFGGGQSLQLTLNEDVDATVIYYGSLVEDEEQLQNINGPVLGIFGSEDQSIPISSVESFESSLTNLGVKNMIYIYEGVGHAFANPSGSNYAPNETIDAWDKTLDFLNENLKNQ